MDDTNDSRPTWEFKTPINIAKWINEHSIKNIEIYHRHSGSMTTEHYLIFSTYTFRKEEAKLTENRLEKVSPLIFAYDYKDKGYFKEVRFTPWYEMSLVDLDGRLIKTLRDIREWDETHKKDIAEYSRLKKKFND